METIRMNLISVIPLGTLLQHGYIHPKMFHPLFGKNLRIQNLNENEGVQSLPIGFEDSCRE